MKREDFILIARRELGPTHGTGQQLSILKATWEGTINHIGWGIPGDTSPEFRPDVDLTPVISNGCLSRLPLNLGTRIGHRLGYGLFGTRNLKKARSLLQSSPNTPVLAVVASERDARMVNCLLGATGHPLSLLVFDYCHEAEPAPAQFPEWATACRKAGRVFALGPALGEAMQKLGAQHIEKIHFARPAPAVTGNTAGNKGIRVAMIGSLAYPEGMRLLMEAMGAARMSDVEIHHTGPDVNLQYVPERLRSHFVSHGLVSNEERDAILASCHGAILPGPDLDPASDPIARYSVPSRLADYAFHGLPLITLAREGSGLSRYLEAHPQLAAVRAADAERLQSEILKLPARQTTEAVGIVDFARQHYDADHAYGRLLSLIKRTQDTTQNKNPA